MISENIQWLEALRASRDLEQLKTDAGEFNLFEALGVVRQEIRHSHFLATLFNPCVAHGLGTQVFERVFSRILQENEGRPEELSLQEFEVADYSDLSVDRERWNIDLLLVSAQNKHVFVVENKIDAGEHGDQLARYHHRIDQEFPRASGYKRVFVFLTLDGSTPSMESWTPASHEDVIQQLEALLERRTPRLPVASKIAIEHYIILFRRRLLGNSEIDELCEKIYREHGKALDLIYERKPDRNSEVMTYVSEFLQEPSADHDFVFDSRERSLCRFFSKSWLDHPQQQSGQQNWGNHNCVLMFEFKISASNNTVMLNLYIGPGDAEYRQQVFDVFQEGSGFRAPGGVKKVNSKQSGKFTAVLLFGDFVPMKEELDEQEFKNELSKRFSAFCQNDWPVVQSALAPLMKKSE